MTEFRKLADDFYVAPQLEPADLRRAAALGIRTIINNRPDAEFGVEMKDAAARAAAAAAGLAYVHVPVVSGAITTDDLRAFCAAVDGHEGPFLAYCRSGMRSSYMWAFSAVRSLPVAHVIAAAAAAGYDLGPAAAALAQVTARD